MSGRRAPGLAFVVLCAFAWLLSGCANDRVVELTDWDLVVSGSPPKPVHLPAHVEGALPRADTTYTLRAHVTLPDDLRERRLTLAVPALRARMALFVDGEEMAPLDDAMRLGYRGVDQSAFRIPARAAHGGALAIDLVVSYRQLLAARIDLPPRLSATEEGDLAFRFVRGFNRWTAVLALVVAFLTTFTYALVYLRDRRRVAYGWFALQAFFGAAFYAATQQGVLQLVAGPYETPLCIVASTLGLVASVQFTHEQFGLGRPNAMWWGAVAVSSALSLAVRSPFVAPLVVCQYTMPLLFLCVGYQVVTTARLCRRRGASLDALVIMLTWVQLFVFGAPDNVAWAGQGEIAGGLRTCCLALTIIAIMHAFVLSRDHHVALTRADELNDELKLRVRALEAKNGEVQQLNDELRRQIGTRADTLAAALTRASTLAGGMRELLPGEQIGGRYEILRVVGQGGAGVVYEVRRLSDDARLALKLLNGTADTTDMARFAREAQLIAKLDHPNVVRIVNVDVSASGFFYLVVEFVSGLSLVQHRAQYGDARWAMVVLRQIAEGLAAIHAQGIVHRDLKPANVLVTGDARTGTLNAKIADFGIASAARDRASPASESEADLLLTTTGAWIGTPKYMAPELACGARGAGGAADVFSFGLIAYELLHRELPYEGSAALSRARGDAYRAPRVVRSRCPWLEPAVADVIDRCFAERPEDRPDARTLADAFAARRVEAA